MRGNIGELTADAEERWEAGPTRLRWATLPPQLGDPAPDAILPDHEGRPTTVSSLWADQPVLLLFWRHFGCSWDAPDAFLRCEPAAGMELAASRHGTDRALVDDAFQLPGEFVIGSNGIIAYAHRYGWCEDHPDPRVHVAAIRQAAGRLEAQRA